MFAWAVGRNSQGLKNVLDIGVRVIELLLPVFHEGFLLSNYRLTSPNRIDRLDYAQMHFLIYLFINHYSRVLKPVPLQTVQIQCVCHSVFDFRLKTLLTSADKANARMDEFTSETQWWES